jgi:hypothetical protein
MDLGGRRVEGFRAVAAVFVGSRVALVLIALFALRYFPLNSRNRDHNAAFAVPVAAGDRWREPPVAADQAVPPQSKHAEPSGIAVWARWDALWYARIAELGYAGRFGVDDLPGQSDEPPATGFYPLMPLMMRVVGWLVGSPLRAGLLIANASLLLSLWLLVRMARRLLGEEAAVAAGTLLLLYPPAFFLSAPYSDSLGLALSLACMTLALDGRLGAAGFFGFLSALTRPTGVLLAPAIWLQWWKTRRANPSSAKSGASWGLVAGFLPILGMAAFLAYCGFAFGDPLAPFHRQATWRGAMGFSPLILRELSGGPWSLMATRHSYVELAAAVLFVALGLLAFRYVPLPLAVYGLGATLLPLWTSLFSFSRLALASFPVFLTAGAILRRRPAAARAVETFFAVALGLFAILYFTWNWIG